MVGEDVFPTESNGLVGRFPATAGDDHTIGIGGPAMDLILVRPCTLQEDLEAIVTLNGNHSIPDRGTAVAVGFTPPVAEGESAGF